MTSTRTAAADTAQAAFEDADDAIALLMADHEAMREMFREYERTRVGARKIALVGEICSGLSIHAQIEHEIFYPEVKAALPDAALISDATLAHARIERLLELLKGAQPVGPICDARVRALAEYVRQHVAQEHSEMFPKAESAWLDMAELGGRMAARKHDLLGRSAGVHVGHGRETLPGHAECDPVDEASRRLAEGPCVSRA